MVCNPQQPVNNILKEIWSGTCTIYKVFVDLFPTQLAYKKTPLQQLECLYVF